MNFGRDQQEVLARALARHGTGLAKQCLESQCIDCPGGKTMTSLLDDHQKKHSQKKNGRGNNQQQGNGRGNRQGNGNDGRRGRGRRGRGNNRQDDRQDSNRGQKGNKQQQQGGNGGSNNTGSQKGWYLNGLLRG